MNEQTNEKKATKLKQKMKVCIQDRQKCPAPQMRQNEALIKDEGSAARGCLLLTRTGG